MAVQVDEARSHEQTRHVDFLGTRGPRQISNPRDRSARHCDVRRIPGPSRSVHDHGVAQDEIVGSPVTTG